MSTDNHTRHTVAPQRVPVNGPMWSGDVDDSSMHDTIGLNDNYVMNQTFFFDEEYLSGGSSFTGSLFSNMDTSTLDSQSASYSQNALGLDPVTASTRLMDHIPHLHSAHGSPSTQARAAQLPQIITSDLPLSQMHSPVDYHTGSYSAYSSSPSSIGHGTMPMTPASLPAGSQLGPPVINSGPLLSPGSPYPWPYGSPVAKSPYSSPAPRSPSVLSYSSHSPTEDTHANVPRQIPPTVPELAGRFPGAHLLVPQRTYRPHTQSDRRRYVEEVDLEGPIMFFTTGPDGCGISCRDALNCKFARLVGRDDQMFINRGPSVSIRIMWPGYAPWSRQIPTRDFRSPPGPITRSKLAKNVAKTVQRFIDDCKTKNMEEEVDARWRIGPSRISIDDLELVGLQHVSMGSWQAHLRLRPRV